MYPFNRHVRLRESLSAYIDGELSARDAQKLESHLQSCLACREELEGQRLASSALRELQAAEAPRSFALTPDMVARPAPAPAPAPARSSLPALNTGLRLAAASLAVALAAVMIVDRADFVGNNSSNSNSDSAAVAERNAGATTSADRGYRALAPSGADADTSAAEGSAATSAAPAASAPTSVPSTGTPGAISGGVGGVSSGGTGAGGPGTEAESPADASAPVPETTQAPEPTNDTTAARAAGDSPTPSEDFAGALDDAAEDTGAPSNAESAAAEGDDGGTDGAAFAEGTLAVLLGVSLGGLVVLAFVRRRERF